MCNHSLERAAQELADATAQPPFVVDRRVDPALAQEVAAAYLDMATPPDPLTRTACARLITESNGLFELITPPDRPDPTRCLVSSRHVQRDTATARSSSPRLATTGHPKSRR